MQKTSTSVTQVYDSGSIRFQWLYELKQVFRYRYLVQNLVSRDLKVRYKRSAIGFIWVMLNPLLTMLIATFVFSQIIRVQQKDFPTYALAGVLLFNVFAQGTTAAMSNLTGNGPILSRLYIPPSVYVLSAIGSALVNFFYALVPLAVIILIVDQIRPSLFWLLTIIPIAEITLLSTGIGLIVSASMVYFRDTFEIYAVLITFLNYLTPLFYPFSALKVSQLINAEQFNPLFVIIDTFRSIIIYSQLPSTQELIVGVSFAFVSILIGWLVFVRLELGFPYQF